MCPSWIAAPTRLAVNDLTTDIEIQRVFSVFPDPYCSSAILPSLITKSRSPG